MQTNPSDKYNKQSKIGSIIASLGVVAMIVSMLLILILNKHKDDSLTQVQQKLEQHVQKDSVLEKLKNSPIDKVIDQIECEAIDQNKKLPSGKEAWQFTFKVTDKELLKELSKVGYLFNHPTFNPKLKISKDSLHEFKLSYTGWGCLGLVKIILYKKNKTTDTIDFAMCDKMIAK